MLNMRLKCLSLKEKTKKREMGAVGRHFKLNLENRFLMLLVYYRLVHNLHFGGFSL